MGTELFAVAIADFNKEDKQDLMVTILETDTGKALTFLGDGSGGFSSPIATNAGTSIYARMIETGDFNNDGNLDATFKSPSGKLSILLGDGTGAFSVSIFTVDYSAYNLTTGDYNKDGNLDIATANYYSEDVTVFFGVFSFVQFFQNPTPV